MIIQLKRQYFLIFCFLFSSQSLFAQSATKASPKLESPLPAPAIWLRADLGKFTHGLWADKSGYKRHATALSEESPLKKGMINFHPAISFDGVNDYMKIPYSAEALPALTILAVFKSADTTERGIWGAEKAFSRNLMLSTRRVAGPDSVIDLYGPHENKAVISSIV